MLIDAGQIRPRTLDKESFTLINTNARSLKPKTESLLENIKELGADFAVITETWLRDDDADEMERTLKLGSGLGFLYINRRPNDNGVSYGGVALVWKESRGTFKRFSVRNPDGFEVLAAAGSIRGQSRKIIIIACYLPPSYNRTKGAGALDYIEDVVIEAKRIYSDPYLIVTGDFNQWRVAEPLENFPGITEVAVGNTRGSRSIDKIFCNMGRSITESGTCLLYTSPSPRDRQKSRMPSSA